MVVRHVAEADIFWNVSIIRQCGAAVHRIENLFGWLDNAFCDGVGKHRDGVVTYHAPVFVAHVRPHRKHVMYALLIMFQHRLHEVGIALRLQHVHQRMEGTVGVPKREHGVVGEAVGMVYVVVETAVVAVDVHVDRRIYHGVIQRSVKHSLLILSALRLDD